MPNIWSFGEVSYTVFGFHFRIHGLFTKSIFLSKICVMSLKVRSEKCSSMLCQSRIFNLDTYLSPSSLASDLVSSDFVVDVWMLWVVEPSPTGVPLECVDGKEGWEFVLMDNWGCSGSTGWDWVCITGWEFECPSPLITWGWDTCMCCWWSVDDPTGWVVISADRKSVV